MSLDHGSHTWEFLKIMLAERVLDEDSKVADASRYKALAFPKRPCLEKPPHEHLQDGHGARYFDLGLGLPV